jgi:transposase
LTQTRLCIVHVPIVALTVHQLRGNSIMMTANPRRVTGGFDTHADTNVGAVLDTFTLQRLATETFATTAHGHAAALAWLAGFGTIDAAGIESTGSYGAGLARHFTANGVKVLEVNRPERFDRRLDGKDDFVDAEAAARAVLSGRASAIPKSGDGPVEAIRVLEIAHESAIGDRTEAINQFKALLIRAPAAFRDRQSSVTFRHQLATARRSRHSSRDDIVTAELKVALRVLALRIEFLEHQVTELADRIRPILSNHYPALLGLHGIGVHSAAQLLMTAGDNPHRMHSEAAFAKLCAACPQPASSGKTIRYRLDRGGDRRANKALYRIVIVRMRFDARTRDYVTRRLAEGKTKREIIRCLKRFVAREVFHAITDTHDPIPTGDQLRTYRKTASISLVAAATGAGVSYPQLSQIERGITFNTDITRRVHHWITTTITA